jgi:hypothetical protein
MCLLLAEDENVGPFGCYDFAQRARVRHSLSFQTCIAIADNTSVRHVWIDVGRFAGTATIGHGGRKTEQ